ncbi:MAG: hypothetical protein Q9192_005986, partial [Flavoplaca navasiana]
IIYVLLRPQSRNISISPPPSSSQNPHLKSLIPSLLTFPKTLKLTSTHRTSSKALSQPHSKYLHTQPQKQRMDFELMRFSLFADYGLGSGGGSGGGACVVKAVGVVVRFEGRRVEWVLGVELVEQGRWGAEGEGWDWGLVGVGDWGGKGVLWVLIERGV